VTSRGDGTDIDTLGRQRRRWRRARYSRELVELLFMQPYCRISNVVDAGSAQRQAASEYLKALAAIGVLEEKKLGREKLFIKPRLMKLLTSETQIVRAFAARKGRR
jgi:hypothetical protein